MSRSLLGLRELPVGQIEDLLAVSQHYVDRDGNGAVDLTGKTVASLFYEPSTRTELSFELAAKRLGSDVMRCDVARSSVQKGESLVDTVRTIESLGADAIVMRHPSSGAPWLVSRHVACSVLNAGDGMHEHPTQGLIDLLTVRQSLGRIAGRRIAIVGDVRHSRVARSAVWGFTKLGAEVTFVAPRTLLPADVRELPVRSATSLEDSLRGADVIMALRMQLEREAGGDVPSLSEYVRGYGLSEEIVSKAAPNAIIMHPGPMNTGVELREDIASGPRSVIQRQVRNGLYVRMAVLTWALETASTQSPQSTDVYQPLNGDRIAQPEPAYAGSLNETGKTGRTGKT